MGQPSHNAPSAVGDLAALGRLWDEHSGRLLLMLERRTDPGLRRKVGVDAILQATFLDAARAWERYQGGSKMRPYPWLYRLALDRLIAEYRTHVRPDGAGRDQPWGEDCSALLGGHLPDTGTGPLTAAQRAELADRVRHALALLPGADRELVEMRYFDQLATQEICDVLADRDTSIPPVTENALNVRMFRALKKFQKCWQSVNGPPESGT